MTNTDKIIDGKVISYEILNGDSGYLIYLDGTPWIKQESSGYIPYNVGTMEENCLAHINQLVTDFENAAIEKEKEENMYEETKILKSTIDYLLTEVIPSLFIG